VNHGRAALIYALLASCGGLVAVGMINPRFEESIRVALPLIVVGLAGMLTVGTETLAARKHIDGAPPAAQPTVPVPRPR
jgi:hypothetical protein